MAMADPSRDFEKPSLRGTSHESYVIDTNDPEHRQRVRIRTPVLHRGIPDSKLPWANIQGPATANAGDGVGTAHVPEKWSKVNTHYLENDPHKPQYSSSPASDDVNKQNELLGEDYPNTYGQIDSYGNRTSTNRATGDVTFAHRSGTTIHIDGSGNVTVASAGDINIAAKNNIIISAGGRIKVSAGSDILLDGSNVLLNSNSADAPNIPGKRKTPKIPDRSGQTNL